MKTIKGDLILSEDTKFNESIKVEGDIKGDYNLKVKGNINCWNIDCRNINCWNIDCRNINCWNIDCRNINCWNIDCLDINCLDINCEDIDCRNINCEDINCEDINYYAFVIAYNSFKCISAEGRRENSLHKCLDQPIEYKKDEYCEELEEEK